jgi:ABC-2 type transport system ATP-binding protein
VRIERERAHELVARLAEAFPGRIDSVTVARPTLEDVFLHRTGHPFEDIEDREGESAG